MGYKGSGEVAQGWGLGSGWSWCGGTPSSNHFTLSCGPAVPRRVRPGEVFTAHHRVPRDGAQVVFRKFVPDGGQGRGKNDRIERQVAEAGRLEVVEGIREGLEDGSNEVESIYIFGLV